MDSPEPANSNRRPTKTIASDIFALMTSGFLKDFATYRDNVSLWVHGGNALSGAADTAIKKVASTSTFYSKGSEALTVTLNAFQPKLKVFAKMLSEYDVDPDRLVKKSITLPNELVQAREEFRDDLKDPAKQEKFLSEVFKAREAGVLKGSHLKLIELMMEFIDSAKTELGAGLPTHTAKVEIKPGVLRNGPASGLISRAGRGEPFGNGARGAG